MNNLYEVMGGDDGIKALVAHFYDLMDTDPRFKALRDVHAQNLDSARQKLYEYLSGWTGGPSLYTDKYGHPRLRQRHMGFKIEQIHAKQWMDAMNEAMLAQSYDDQLHSFIYERFEKLAYHMINHHDAIN